jgi:hypothetical protein|tara:strand:- start:718 stop:963 length:246 start_codon:yes stop_codon:yes gene_type:complete
METLMQKYRENEDGNAHTENYLLLAKYFGTADQVDAVKKILDRNNKRGYAIQTDLAWMYKKINPYFAKLKATRKLIDQKYN